MKMRGLFSAALLFFCSVTQAAMWVEDLKGAPAAFRLERGGQMLPMRIYQLLQPGDRLIIQNPDHSILLLRDDDARITVDRKNSPYEVQEVGAPLQAGDNLLAWASNWLTEQLKASAEQPPASGTTEPVTIPLAPAGTARLLAATRSLHLAWQGGSPPFHLRLTGEDDQEPLLELQEMRLEGLETSRYNSESLILDAGRYQLTIGDARDDVTVEIEAVPAEQLPSPPPELGLIGSDELKAVLYALWLASRDETLILEAYQRATELGGNHPPALILKRSLEKGVRPPPPTTVEGFPADRPKAETQ